MVLNRFYEFNAVKGFFLILTLFENVVDGQIPTQSRMQPVPQKICSNECKTWTPKEGWDDYVKRKVWKMICENEEYKCCPGYEGPQCETECFDCNRINGFERRFVEIYGKIKSLENTYTNQAIIINGSISKDNTGDKLTKSCTCSAGPRGQQGPAGPVGPPGAQGRQGIQGSKGPAGDRGLPGPPGPHGLDGLPGATGPRGFMGLPGILGQTGQKGEAGLPGRHGRSGRKGEPGLNGLKGAEGQPGRPCRADISDAACAKGEPGPPGLPGRDGHTGLQGKPGLPGLKGTPGFNGQPGRYGARGEKGKPGVPGINGRPGLPGPKGETGVQGYKGPTGRPGLGGKPGEKGAPGLPGLDGRPCDITKVEESRTFREMQSIIENLVTRLEITTGQVEELRAICNRNVGCHFNCTADSFKCSCGMCIPQKFRCDGFPQCPDGSDEFESDCAIHCNKGNVPCRDGKKCVKLEERCDGKEDCPDGSDEENCDIEKQKQQHDNNFR